MSRFSKAVDKQALLEWSLVLLWQALTSTTGNTTKDKLCLELPFAIDVPDLGCLLVWQWVVMLQIGTKAFCLQDCPCMVLVHGIGSLRPLWHFVGIHWHLALQALDSLGVLVEQNLDDIRPSHPSKDNRLLCRIRFGSLGYVVMCAPIVLLERWL